MDRLYVSLLLVTLIDLSTLTPVCVLHPLVAPHVSASTVSCLSGLSSQSAPPSPLPRHTHYTQMPSVNVSASVL